MTQYGHCRGRASRACICWRKRHFKGRDEVRHVQLKGNCAHRRMRKKLWWFEGKALKSFKWGLRLMEPPWNLYMLFLLGLSQVATCSTEFCKAGYRRPENECVCKMIILFTHFCASSYRYDHLWWLGTFCSSRQSNTLQRLKASLLCLWKIFLPMFSGRIKTINFKNPCRKKNTEVLGNRRTVTTDRSFELKVTAGALNCLCSWSRFGLVLGTVSISRLGLRTA